MIHDAAADAVGEVLKNGETEGHCVLIGQRIVVTCAHVLSYEREKPTEQVPLRFPRLDGFEAKGSVVGWAPLSVTPTEGEEIALIALGKDAPTDKWLKLEATLPATGSNVVMLDYLSGILTGDPRKGKVHYATDASISLDGDERHWPVLCRCRRTAFGHQHMRAPKSTRTFKRMFWLEKSAKIWLLTCAFDYA